MGQGTDSCGGYEIEYDEYSEGLENGVWTQRDGTEIKVSDMQTAHIKKCISLCSRLAKTSSFECDSDKWQSWIDIFKNELSLRVDKSKAQCTKIIKAVRGSTVTMICFCGCEYEARTADIKRGWALSCSKRCAAIRREYKKPAAKPKGK